MENYTDDRSWLLITKSLSNELEGEEKLEFDNWLKDEANQKEYARIKNVWHYSGQKEEMLFDLDNSWAKMDKRIAGDTGNIQFTRKRLFISAIRIAASILFLMTLAFVARYFISESKFKKITAQGKMITSPVILPDNTKVYLNAGSTLIYPKDFGKGVRNVELKGEAFFEVTRNEKAPFIIHTANAQIKVLGTSFNVNAYNATDSVQVIVKTGLVELSGNNKISSIQLPKGTTGVFYNSKNKAEYTQPDINSLAWFSNSIVFNSSDMRYVVKTLEHVFGKKIEIGSGNIINCRLKAEFKDKELNNILESLKTSLNIDYKKTAGGYILTGPGC